MSTSGSQKVRRNAASPSSSARQGPLRATQQFALFTGTHSPSRKHAIRQGVVSSPTSKNSKPTKTRSHSETAFVCDRRSPTSPVYKVEKPKALRATSSVDNINMYLSGQWPKDGCSKQRTSQDNTYNTQTAHTSASYYSDGVHKKDKHTQTPEEWEEGEYRRPMSHSKLALYKRSKSVGNTDTCTLKSSKDIKAKLQRKDNSTKGSQSMQRFSPVPVITTTFSPHSTQPIKIPVPLHDSGVLRGTPGKARASVEGLNQEIEKLIISATTVGEEDTNSTVTVGGLYEQPDGHRAPVPDVLNNTRSVDTQTPSQSDLYTDRYVELSIADYGGRSSSRASTDTDDGSRPQSVSPSPFMLGPLDIEEPVLDAGDAGKASITEATSPRPNNSARFIRLPPDGAEKLKSVVEIATKPQLKNLLSPVIMSTVNLQPSERSAFSSLGKSSTIVPRMSPIRFVEESH